MITATITMDGKRILARYDGGWGRKIASRVPGARAMWDKSVEPNVFLGWSYPLTMDTCRAFRRVYGQDGLTVMPPLVKWARAQVGRERTLESLREGLMSGEHLDRVASEAPDLMAAMLTRPYQLAGAGFMLAGETTILADDPGLGKTLQTLAAIIQSDSRVILVGCRKSAMRSVWERETLRWAPGIAVFVAQGTRAEREKVFGEFSDHPTVIPGTRKMLVINIEMVRAKREEYCPASNGPCFYGSDAPAGHNRHEYRATPDFPFLFDQEWDAMIFDESHNLLASTANIQSKRITQQRFGAMKLRGRLRKGGLAIALSGTPFRSKLPKGWGTLNWLNPKLFGSYWRFAETYFGVTEDEWGHKQVAGGAKAPEPLDAAAWDRMLRPWYLKRTKAEAAPDLPPIQYAGTPIDPRDPASPCYVQLEMDPKQARIYHQMAAEAEATLDGGRITATGVLAEITRARQFANASARRGPGRSVLPDLPSNKLEWLIDFMQEREDTGGKVVVASSFSEMVELAADVLRKEGWEVLTLTGATSDRDRVDLVARFQDPNDPLRVVVINREAGGESITLDAADEMVVLDQPWISDKDEQLESRIHRVSRVHQVIIYRLVSIGTVDFWMASLTDEQRAVVSQASPRKLSEMVREGLES